MTEQEKEKIRKIFKDNKLYYGWGWDLNDVIQVEIVDGDWKHDHILLDKIMKDNGYEKVDEHYFGEPTGGDWYSSVHYFKNNEDIEENLIKRSNNMKLTEAKEILNSAGYLVENSHDKTDYESAEEFKSKFIDYWGDKIAKFRNKTKNLKHIEYAIYVGGGGAKNENIEDMAEEAYDLWCDYGYDYDVNNTPITIDYWIKEIGYAENVDDLTDKEKEMVELVNYESDSEPFDLSWWKDDYFGDFSIESNIKFITSLDNKLDKKFF